MIEHIIPTLTVSIKAFSSDEETWQERKKEEEQESKRGRKKTQKMIHCSVIERGGRGL
jgi:hypothetical protein